MSLKEKLIPINGDTIITTETVKKFTPSLETVTNATTAFANAGFEVGRMVGISFSITAPLSTFQEVFNIHLRETEDAGIEVINNDGSGCYELPLDELPESIANYVENVTFTLPPDFGPTEFFGP